MTAPSIPPIAMRTATEDEMNEVADLLVKAYREFAARMPAGSWDLYSQNIRDIDTRMPESDLIVAEHDGRIVGSATLYTLAKRVPDAQWPQGWTAVRLVGVDPEVRGHGVGKRLMEECIRRSRDEGAVAMGLHTTPLMTTAKRMYEGMGFTRAEDYDFHPRPDFTVMAYKLELLGRN